MWSIQPDMGQHVLVHQQHPGSSMSARAAASAQQLDIRALQQCLIQRPQANFERVESSTDANYIPELWTSL
jgi:hypothetical protein